MNQPIMTMTKYSQVWPAWLKSISYDEIMQPPRKKQWWSSIWNVNTITQMQMKKIYKYKYTEKQITILRWLWPANAAPKEEAVVIKDVNAFPENGKNGKYWVNIG